MKQTLKNSAIYFSFWMFFFTTDRVFSLLYHFSKTRQTHLKDLLGCFWNGWRMDASTAAFICALPFLLFLFRPLIRPRQLTSVLSVYTFLLLPIQVAICLADRGLFAHWGFRIDATPLQFLDTPREMLASLTRAELLTAFVFGPIYCVLWCYIASRFIRKIQFSERQTAPILAKQFVLLPLLVLLMRGGWQHLPMNASLVYFSDSIYANQTAINPVWNFFYAVSKRDAYKKVNPYNYFSDAEAALKCSALLPVVGDSADVSILTIDKPNVIIIIWESFTAKMFAPLGGEKGVTPQTEAIAEEGLLFTNIYANGNRSDKGLPAIGSAYPAQPSQSIAFLTGKMLKLPHLSSAFNRNGYSSSFYYGGDLNFGNMFAFYNNGGYSPIVGKSDFSEKDITKKWGASDGAVFRKFLDYTPDDSRAFFKTLFTLSSHEPFDVPMRSRFYAENEDAKFRNAFAYTDSCVGAFVKEAKTKKWWDSTLVIIVADHGTTFPQWGSSSYELPEHFHVPLIFTGGALRLKGRVDAFGNQTDIAATLLHQLGWSSADFPFSRDLFSGRQRHFAHYVFTEGFGYLDKNGAAVYKHDAAKYILRKGLDEQALDCAKAYLQETYRDFISK